MSLKGSYPETPRDVSDLTQTTLYPAQGSVVTHRTAECVPGTSITLAELGEDELLKGGNCGLKDSQPPTGGAPPVGASALPQEAVHNFELHVRSCRGQFR